MVTKRDEFADLSDQAYERIQTRLVGLTDEEYFWEPAPGCWSIREGCDGSWQIDWPLPRPDPEPFSTIAWRLWHLIDMYGENRAATWLDVAAQGDAVGFEGPDGPPPTAAEALAMLDRAHDRWDAHLALATDESLAERVGPVGGGYADRTRANYVLHMLDEFIHHGAEIALLRDLWRWQHPVGSDPIAERVMRNDLSVLDDIDVASSGPLVVLAAEYARWKLVTGLVEAGAPVDSPGSDRRTPLHVAAGAGEFELVKFLVGRGADIAVKDPDFHATPATWARFLSHDHIAEWLESQPTP